MRGEHPTISVPFALYPGSSPHARGAPTNSASGSLVKMTFSTFLNSAGVLGESTWMVELSWALRRISFATSVGSLMGSSPHARGAQSG